LDISEKRKLLLEYAKCAENPAYTIESYFETFDKTQEGFVPFKLFDKQRLLIHNYENNRFNLVLKYRQAGISTVTAAYAAVKTAFALSENPERVLILANKQETAVEFLNKITSFIKQLPKWVDVSFNKSSQKHVKLSNGSELKAVATSTDALRGYTPTIMILDEAAFIEGGQALWSACLAAIGCLDESTMILTNNGFVELGDIIENKLDLGFHPLTKGISVINKDNKFETPDKGYKSSYTDTYTIKTRFGHTLTGSWKHPLMVNGQWKQMQQIVKGDRVKFGYNQEVFGDNDIIDMSDVKFNTNADKFADQIDLSKNLDLVYLMGLFLAEGNYIKGGLALTCGDKEIQDRLLTDGYWLKRWTKNVTRNHHFYINSTYYNKLFQKVGLVKVDHASKKVFPKQILKSSSTVILSFLRGMFDGDGCSNNKIVKYSTTSKRLAEQLQVVLLNFGIRSRISHTETKTSNSSVISNKNHICKIYEVFILESNIPKFYEKIGFGLDRKQDNLKYHIGKKNKTKVDVTKSDVVQLLKDNNISSSEYEKKYRFLDSAKRYDKGFLTYYAIEKLINLSLSGDAYKRIVSSYNLSKQYFEDEVVDIIKSEGWTYDLHLPETHSFNSAGFISHNTGGKAFLISTPNGLDEIYYEAYEGAISNTNKFKITHLKWWQDPRFNKDLRLIKTSNIVDWIQKPENEKTDHVIESAVDLHYDVILKFISEGYKPHSTWYENMCRDMNLNRRMINQELECAFIGSGDNVVEAEVIRSQEELNVTQPIFKAKDWDNNVWIWKLPEKGHRYILALDVSRGDSEDATGMCIIDYDTFEQVLEYHGKIPPDVAAQLVDHYGRMYNALSTFDITGGMGIAATSKLKELNYPKSLLHYDNISEDMYHIPPPDAIPGINFASKNRRSQIIAALEEAIARGGFKIRSERLIAELKKFIYKNGRPDHLKGSHDDLIMALGMCLFVANTSFKKLLESDNLTKAMLDSWKTNINTTPTKSNYLLEEITSRPDPNKKYSNNNQDILRNTRDFSWLFGNINK